MLDPKLANQIAAGEVVERPASVVKELVENALDAGARNIQVTLEEAGLKLIQVLDDGSGIAKEDARLAFERHATSKLHRAEDLFRIRTLGFRGEALPSIASVSIMSIETAQADLPGIYLLLEGGEIKEERSAPARRGTKIKVEQLFYNTPARLKHIKTLPTELGHVTDLMNRFALARYDVAFELIHDGHTLLKTFGNNDQQQAIAGVYGVPTARKMKAIHAKNFNFEVNGFVSLPELTRASNRYITLVVNGRYVKNFKLNQAIESGYGSKLMVGRHPIAILQITLDPLLVDVNVHPTKQYIRISIESELGQLIQQAIAEVFSRTVRIPSGLENIYGAAKYDMPNQKDENAMDDNEWFANSANSSEEHFSPHLENKKLEQTSLIFKNESNESTTISKENDGTRDTFYPFQEENVFHFNESENSVQTFPAGHSAYESADVGHFEGTKASQQMPKLQIQAFPMLEYIGQLHGTYLLAQDESGLYLIDQHAAQERIKYEYFRETIGEEGTVQQDLLFSIMLEYPADEALIIQQNLDKLKEAGIYLEDFGSNTFIIRQHPAWIAAGEVEEMVREMIDFFLENHQLSMNAFREATAIMMSCKRSIKANHYLTENQARQLITDLSRTKNPYNCPHGRPTTIRLTKMEIEKMFKRIQDPH